MGDGVMKPPERVYTMVEVAKKLRVGRRAVQDLIKAYPFYHLNGRRKLFDDEDIAMLWEAMKARQKFELERPASSPFRLPGESLEDMFRDIKRLKKRPR